MQVFTNTNIPDEQEFVDEKRVQQTKIDEFCGVSNGGLNRWKKVDDGLHVFSQLVEFQEKEA